MVLHTIVSILNLSNSIMYRQPTPEAVLLKTALEKLGLRVMVEVDDGFKHIDLSIPDSRINIEIDGLQHLTDPYQILSDLKRAHAGLYPHISEFYSEATSMQLSLKASPLEAGKKFSLSLIALCRDP